MVPLSDACDLGRYCFVRHTYLSAPMPAGRGILFIGNSPPPAPQWRAQENGDRNPTIAQLENFLRSADCIARLMAMGLHDGASSSRIKLHVANIIPMVSASSQRIGAHSAGRGILFYTSDGPAQKKNMQAIRLLVESGAHDLIILGCGKAARAQSPFAERVVRYLREHAEGRTILFCSVGAKEANLHWSRRYAGHPRPGHHRGVAAQPLSEFLRYRLTDRDC